MSEPTLDQLRVLAAIAETGSFSAAGRRLRRTQSVISHSIAGLEAQLGLTLFERAPGRARGGADPCRTAELGPGRRPRLTEAGRALLVDARRIGVMMDELRARAAGLTRGLEAELGLAVDVMFPTARLVAVLDAFARAYPTVALRLRVEALGGPVQLLLDRACDLGVVGGLFTDSVSLAAQGFGAVTLITVCAPGHPLAEAAGDPAGLADATVREHVQLVLSDRSTLSAGRDFGVTALRSWRLGDLGAKHALLLAGLGWGHMPDHMVAADLQQGRLVRLHLARAASVRYPLALCHRADARPGPAAQWLARQLAAETA